MSRPRFLVNHDFNEQIARGLERAEPAVELVRVRELGLAAASDPELLEFAAAQGWIVLSHDVNTMTAAAKQRLTQGLSINGLILAHQHSPVGHVFEDLLLIWASSEAEEWVNQVRFLPL